MGANSNPSLKAMSDGPSFDLVNSAGHQSPNRGEGEGLV